MNSDIDANLNLDELFKTIERTNHRKNSSDKDALPEQTLKKNMGRGSSSTVKKSL